MLIWIFVEIFDITMVPFKHSVSFGLNDDGASDNRAIPVDIDEWHNLSVLLRMCYGYIFDKKNHVKMLFCPKNDVAYNTRKI